MTFPRTANIQYGDYYRTKGIGSKFSPLSPVIWCSVKIQREYEIFLMLRLGSYNATFMIEIVTILSHFYDYVNLDIKFTTIILILLKCR